MDIALLVGPAVVAAIVSSILGLISLVVSTQTTRGLHAERLEADTRIAQQKSDADIALAEKKLELDRSLADWKRRAEFAEEILADFYHARDIFNDSRQPFAMAGEGRSRPGRTDSDSDLERYRDALYTPFERLSREREFLASITSKKFRFMALFGRHTGEAFETLTSAYNQISAATGMLINLPTREVTPSSKRLEAIIGWALEEDPIKTKIDEAVATVEKACAPWLTSTPA